MYPKNDNQVAPRFLPTHVAFWTISAKGKYILRLHENPARPIGSVGKTDDGCANISFYEYDPKSGDLNSVKCLDTVDFEASLLTLESYAMACMRRAEEKPVETPQAKGSQFEILEIDDKETPVSEPEVQETPHARTSLLELD